MKKILFIIPVFTFYTAYAQQTTGIVENRKLKSSNLTAPSKAYYSEVNIPWQECLPKEVELQMQENINRNISTLRQNNPGAYTKSSQVHPQFIWPTQAKAGFTDPSYYTVQFLVDHNPSFGNQLLDYNCGSRTYDWGNGNHQGTDIILWPYAWRRMDEQVMEVIAAAPGVIVNKVDGNYDRNCVNNGAGNWNAIHVMHDDGSIAWYLHFKSGSLTSKSVGDSVALGEYLGTAGSSGSSSWPHLHFQVMDANNDLVDPFDGGCNSMNAGDSWWQNQQPYNVPSVNRICTKSSQIDFYDCPDPEITFEKDTFYIGDSLWLWIYTRDLELNSDVQVNLYDPSMVNQINWVFTVPWATAATSYLRWFYIVDSWWTQGWWTFEVVYGGNTYQHQFYMMQSGVGIAENNIGNSFTILQNPSKDKINISCTSEQTEEIEFTITNMLGTLVQKEKVILQPGNNNLSFTTLQANGIYFITMRNYRSGITYTQKLVLQR